MLLTGLAMLALDVPGGPMQVAVHRDPITDRVTASAELLNDGHRLVLSCEPARYRGIQVHLHSRHWFRHGGTLTGRRTLTYRFDDDAPRRTLWKVRDHDARLTGRRQVPAFIEWLTSSELLVVRASDIEGTAFDMYFPLAGVDEAVTELRAACEGQPPAQ